MVYYLLIIDFTIIDTTRKNTISLLISLTDILVKDKEAKKDNKKRQPLVYNLVLAIIIYKCLCFL